MEWIKEVIEEIKMYLKLRKVISKDCRGELFQELIFSPKDLRERYKKEMEFKNDMNSRWQ